jgi:hypothetical protein
VTEDVGVIIQLPAGSAVDRQLGSDPPPGVADGRAVIERVPADAEGRIVPPEGGEVVLSVLSPEALSREAGQVRREVRRAARGAPPVVVVQVAEELREDELAALLEAAGQARRTVILCILSSI